MRICTYAAYTKANSYFASMKSNCGRLFALISGNLCGRQMPGSVYTTQEN